MKLRNKLVALSLMVTPSFCCAAPAGVPPAEPGIANQLAAVQVARTGNTKTDARPSSKLSLAWLVSDSRKGASSIFDDPRFDSLFTRMVPRASIYFGMTRIKDPTPSLIEAREVMGGLDESIDVREGRYVVVSACHDARAKSSPVISNAECGDVSTVILRCWEGLLRAANASGREAAILLEGLAPAMKKATCVIADEANLFLRKWIAQLRSQKRSRAQPRPANCNSVVLRSCMR
jgi:hypothetical protein